MVVAAPGALKEGWRHHQMSLAWPSTATARLPSAAFRDGAMGRLRRHYAGNGKHASVNNKHTLYTPISAVSVHGCSRRSAPYM